MGAIDYLKNLKKPKAVRKDTQIFPKFEEEFIRKKGGYVPTDDARGMVRRTTKQQDVIDNSLHNVIKAKLKPKLI